MIRKMLVIAAAVAMPAAGLAMVTGTGIASAKTTYAPASGTCAIAGSVTFAAPGLSPNGAITNKGSEKSVASTAPTGSSTPLGGNGAGLCGTGAINAKIISTTTECWSTLPVYSKTSPTGGVLASGAPSTCDVNGDTAASDSSLSATDIKTAIKDQFYYDTTGSFATSGPSGIIASLNAKPAKLLNNGNKGTFTATGAVEELGAGSAAKCGAGVVGFDVTGTSTFAAPASNIEILICLPTDSNGHSTLADFASGTLVAGANIAGISAITYS